MQLLDKLNAVNNINMRSIPFAKCRIACFAVKVCGIDSPGAMIPDNAVVVCARCEAYVRALGYNLLQLDVYLIIVSCCGGFLSRAK